MEALESDTALEYVIVGGFALAAWTGDMITQFRNNGTRRDIDVVVLNDPNGSIDKIKKKNFGVPVSFNDVKPQEYRQHLQLLSHLKHHSTGYVLVFRGIEYALEPEVMRIHMRAVETWEGKIDIPTLNPATLGHLYIYRTGTTKEKDKVKIREFLRTTTPASEISHEPYKVFHKFAGAIRRRYWIYSLLMHLYNRIDHRCYDSQVSHRFIPEWLMMRLIDL